MSKRKSFMPKEQPSTIENDGLTVEEETINVPFVETASETEVKAEDALPDMSTQVPKPDPAPEPEPVPVPAPDPSELVQFIEVDVDKRLVLCVQPGHPRDGWLMRRRGDEVVVPVMQCHGMTVFADLIE